MAKFIAVKINYDHRDDLASHLKYSKLPSTDEYNDYLDQYEQNGIGGNGFHECLNFNRRNDLVRFYLPPTCIPAKKNMEEELVIFSITYKEDKNLPSHIVGVHANVSLLTTQKTGIEREKTRSIDGIGSMRYHAACPTEFCTLLAPTLKYDSSEGRHSKVMPKWGYGLRYLEEEHAKNILLDALKEAKFAQLTASTSEYEIINDQIAVIHRISDRYFPGLVKSEDTSYKFTPPDKEAGLLGEQLVYDREIKYVEAKKGDVSRVEWIANSNPQSAFDIKTIRLVDGVWIDHFLEVKTTSSQDPGMYVSSRQIDFMQAHPNSNLVLVLLNKNGNTAELQDISLQKLMSDFDFQPIKFRLKPKLNRSA